MPRSEEEKMGTFSFATLIGRLLAPSLAGYTIAIGFFNHIYIMWNNRYNSFSLTVFMPSANKIIEKEKSINSWRVFFEKVLLYLAL